MMLRSIQGLAYRSSIYWYKINQFISSYKSYSRNQLNQCHQCSLFGSGSSRLGDSTIPGGGFWRNAWEGLKDGAKETGNFVKSLGTKEGWENLGHGIVLL